MADYAIEAKNISLTYKHIRQSTLKESVLSILSPGRKKGKVKSHTALNNVSFNIERGTTVGILGKNGSGKTTLLRTIARIYSPDSGELKVNAQTVSLLALGVGFDSSMTGLRNIYLNAMLRGATKKQIDEKLDEIIEFSELGDFINAPIKTYSSGMRSRLAFSIAVIFDPEILLIDEALSVGDEAFKVKSFAKMREIIEDKRHTIVMVSHNLSQIKELCDTLIWMDSGKIMEIGNPTEVVNNYLKYTRG